MCTNGYRRVALRWTSGLGLISAVLLFLPSGQERGLLFRTAAGNGAQVKRRILHETNLTERIKLTISSMFDSTEFVRLKFLSV